MNKMILYKEWLKTRWVLLGIVLVMAAITFYCFLNLTKVVQIRGAEILWETLVSKETVLTELFRFVPAVAAALLALAQWLPEMQHKRLKLTLHLPYPQGRMILTIAAYGLLLLTLLYALQAICSALVFSQWIPAELIARILRTMASGTWPAGPPTSLHRPCAWSPPGVSAYCFCSRWPDCFAFCI